MFIRSSCHFCQSRDVHHYKPNGNRLDQMCNRCGANLTDDQIRRAAITRSKRLKNAPRTHRKVPRRTISRFAMFLLLWAVFTLISLPFMSSTVVYASDDTQNTLAGIKIHAENIKKELEKRMVLEKISESETIGEKIHRISKEYGVNYRELDAIIWCESRYNPEAQNITKRESSHGLVQINLRAHPGITIEQAQDEEFAIRFLAKHWKDGKRWMWTNCAKSQGLL